MKHKHTVNRKVKCKNYHRPSIYHVEHAYTRHIHVTIAYRHQNEKITTKEDNVRYWLGEHLLEMYSTVKVS